TRRRARTAARHGLLRPPVAGRRHFQHHTRSDGERVAGYRHARGRQSRTGDRSGHGHANSIRRCRRARRGEQRLLRLAGCGSGTRSGGTRAGRAQVQPRLHVAPLRISLHQPGRRPSGDARGPEDHLRRKNMCGLVGIFDTRGRRDIARPVLERMNESQRHRGPDEDGIHLEPGLGLGHRRLSIIDLSSGRQPIYNEDGTVAVVYNGEIYNYRALIAELTALGHRFRTRSDSEVIVHAWEEWGEGCVERFRGMFAFALWDRRRETLFLARDRLGVKPLHYALLPDGQLLFGSELKSLLAHGGLARDIDPCAVEEYFALGYVAEPRSIFKMAQKLPPAHTLCIRRGTPIPAP